MFGGVFSGGLVSLFHVMLLFTCIFGGVGGAICVCVWLIRRFLQLL